MRLDQLASRPVVHVGPDARLVDVARLMAARRVSFVPVLDSDGRALGMVTEARLLAVLRGDLPESSLALQVATPMLTAPGSLRCDAAYRLCLARGVACLAVVGDDLRVVGVASESDFRRLMSLGALAGRHLVPAVMRQVASVMRPDQTLREAAELLGLGPDAGVVVAEQGVPQGVVTARDAARWLADGTDALHRNLAQVMSRPVVTIGTQASLNEAADLMLAHGVRHLVVTAPDGRLVGMVSEHDLAGSMAVGLMDAAMSQDRVHHRAILDNIPDLVWLKDPDGVYLACNPRFEQLYGCSEAQILGRTDTDFVSAEMAAFFRENDLRAAARNAPTVNEELLTFAADGHQEITQTIKTPVRDGQGRLLGVLGIGRDISALRKVESGFRQLFAHNPAPMAVYERASQRLVSVNDAFCLQYDVSHEDALRMQVSDLMVPEQREAVSAAIPGLRGLVSAEWRHLRHDGTVLDVLVQSHDFEHEGRDCRVVVITDITPIKRAQQRERSRLQLLESLARGEPLSALLRQLALDHEATFPGSLCAVMLLAEDGLHMRHGAAPSLPDFFQQAVDGLAIGPDVGSCGATLATGQRVVVDDIAQHPNWADFRGLASRAGLAACWSTPISGAGGRVLGSYAVYRRCPGAPGDEELAHASFASGLAALAIAQHTSRQALAEHARLVDTMFSQTTDAIVLIDPLTRRFVNFNDAACQGLGYTREAFAALTLPDLHWQRSPPQLDELVCQALTGQTQRLQTLHRRSDGGTQVAQVVVRSVPSAGRQLLSVVWRDITEAERSSDRIRRLNQAYAVLSDVNEAIVRLRQPGALLAEVCRIAVQAGGFRQAWVGRMGADGQQVQPDQRCDAAGPPAGPASPASPPLASGPDSPAWLAIAQQRVVVIDDIATDGRAAAWRGPARAMGIQALAAVPIALAGRAPGVLVLKAGTAGHFDPAQLALYGRLVQDVGHAIASMEAEQARRQEQRLREQLMESVAGLFFVLDSQGRVRLWNRHFAELTGLGAHKIANRPAADFFRADERTAVLAMFKRVLAEGEVQIEAPLTLGDGLPHPYLLVARRVDLEDGPMVVGTGIDISDRVRSEKELGAHRQHLEDLVALRTAELESVNQRLAQEDLRLREMLSLSQHASNLAEAELFQRGIDVLAALSQSPAASLHTVDGNPITPALQAWASSTPPLRRLQAAGTLGGRLWQEAAQRRSVMRMESPPVLAVPIIDQGQVVLVACVADRPTPYDDSDVRELSLAGADLWRIVQRRRTEIALEQAKAAADAANSAKSAFLANMSHEIRTPMNAVLGFAHLLRRSPLAAQQVDHLDKIFDASQHLLQVINDILDFSKIEAHKLVLSPTDFSLPPCVQRVSDMLADKAQANRVRLSLHLAPGCPAVVHGDRLRLEQILLNLLSNAVKFTPGGQVDLQVAPLGASAPGWLRFEVADTGIGISEAQLPQLFQPFEQADASTTRRFGGTGLGLAISHRLAGVMGGRIGVQSRLGEGSRFWLDLPLPATLAPALALPAPVPAAGRPLGTADAPLAGMRVLLAEDNPINQEVALELLTEQGALVDVADDGHEAVAQASARHYDLVLMDVQMPRLDGLQATAAIRSLPGGLRLPIIAMTASAFDEDRAECLAAGMDAVLVKPVEPEALTACLLQWWPGRAATAAAAAGAGTASGADASRAGAGAAARLTGPAVSALLGLRSLLQSHDTEAVDHLARHDAVLRPALGPALPVLLAQVQGFSFAAALDLVDALLATAA